MVRWRNVLLFLVSIIGFCRCQKINSDLCTKLSCSFEVDETAPLCQWTASGGENSGAVWMHAVEYTNITQKELRRTSVLLDAVGDANELTPFQAQNYAAARLKNGVRGFQPHRAVMQSVKFSIPPGEQIVLNFKYFLATFRTSLKLCANQADCVQPLFEAKFDESNIQDVLRNRNMIRRWQPCAPSDGKDDPCLCASLQSVKDGLDCGAMVTEKVTLPPDTRQLFFVADGIRQSGTVSVDAIYLTRPDGFNRCGLPLSKAKLRGSSAAQKQACSPDCFTNGTATEFVGATTLKGPTEEEWDFTNDGCKVVCQTKPECQAYMFDASTDPKGCVLYPGTCDEPKPSTAACKPATRTVMFHEVTACPVPEGEKPCN